MHNVKLYGSMQRVIVRVWYPCETVGFAIPRRMTQGIRARLFQLCIGCEVVVGIFKPSERNPRVVGPRFVLVEMPTVIRRCVLVEIEPMVGCQARLRLWQGTVKVHAHPDGHVTFLRTVALEDDLAIVQVCEYLVNNARAVPGQFNNWRRW